MCNSAMCQIAFALTLTTHRVTPAICSSTQFNLLTAHGVVTLIVGNGQATFLAMVTKTPYRFPLSHNLKTLGFAVSVRTRLQSIGYPRTNNI
eukprot:m.110573 g.110573  ORF g.110573 m.110573 type:complete len:92 (-) comp12891_c0_seq2:972-1247(-)